MNKKIYLKSLYWRILTIISSFGLSYLFYKTFYKSLFFTAVLNVCNHVMYIIFEKVWYKKHYKKVIESIRPENINIDK